MAPLTSRFVLLAALGVATGPAAQAASVDNERAGAAAAWAIAPNDYKLSVPNPDDYKVRPSPDYLLGGAYRKPVDLPAPDPAPIPVADVSLADLPFHDEVLAQVQTSGVEAALVHAVIRVESNYNAVAASPRGAVGLMQLMPDTARRYGVKNSRNPAENIRGGVRYLADLQRIFDYDLNLVLAAYNAGENAVLRVGRSIPKFAETRDYVLRVQAEYQRLRSRSR